MAAKKPDHSRQDPIVADPLIFVHATGMPAVDSTRIEAITNLGLPVYSHAAIAGCHQTTHDYENLGKLLRELCEREPERPVILFRQDLDANGQQLKTIGAQLEAADAALALTVFSNASPDLNPFANLGSEQRPDLTTCREAVRLMGPAGMLPLTDWPEHFMALSADAVSALADPAINPRNIRSRFHSHDVKAAIHGRMFVGTPSATLFYAPRLEPHESICPPPWGGLSASLQAWLDAGAPPIDPIIFSGQPATLHVTHSWGGGVSQWVSTFIDSDGGSPQLQLRSEGPQNNHGYGQKLSLYLGKELTFPVASWWLQPPIQSVDQSNPQYAQVLQEVMSRFDIGRVIISSLVGHSLDALRTGRPTIQVLHDYFPVWPLLSVNPATHADETGRINIDGALETLRQEQEFQDKDAAGWRAVRRAYFEALQRHEVHVAAPSQSVVEMQHRLSSAWDDTAIEVIPHGYPALPGNGPVEPKSRRDGKLRIVIPGRMQPGKGQKLLAQALPELSRYAQIYLVGAGKRAEDFFGTPGVNILINYHSDELAGIMRAIGPHCAALLSVVPETFNFTLSELQQLGIPAIATRMGSFAERIDDGANGWLIEATPEALIERVRALHADPEQIAPVRTALGQIEHLTGAQMVARYDALCPTASEGETGTDQTAELSRAQSSAAQYLTLSERAGNRRLAAQQNQLQKELEERTRWARKADRAYREELATREHYRTLLTQCETERDETRSVLDETQSELQAASLQLKEARASLQNTQDVLGQVLGSSSWRITRPFRVLRRAAGALVRTRAWNPLRWPLLIGRLAHNLSTRGLRGTLVRMQFGEQVGSPAPQLEDNAQPVGDPQPPNRIQASNHPLVSIVVPAYNNWAYTAACLRSIAATASATRIEVILVDDASTDETEDHAEHIAGLRYLRNEENLGFIGSCNRGIEAVRGEFTVILNNDTQVCDGWLDALVDTFVENPDAGLVGAKLVYPDGTLQECGGLIFQDGSGWNYGRGDNPDKPEYKYLRETAYCSGACIMVKTDLLRELGGFDNRYAPAYYEDTDLAFRVRERGLKVYVQPRSVVIHHEGITSGTDLESGIKRHQVTNRETFLQRWREVLESYPPHIADPNDGVSVRRARDWHLRGRVLIIDATTPEPDQDSGSVRLTNLMGCFRDIGYGVTFFAHNRCYAGKYTAALQEAGVEALYDPWLGSLNAWFQERGNDFDYVVVSRHYVAVNYLNFVERFCPQAKFIFDTVDLHYLREQRLAELENSLPMAQAAKQTRRSELAVINATDAVLVVSPAEKEVLADDAPDAMVHILSNIHPVHGRRKGFAERKDLFFVGGYQHPPNVDAMLWFVGEVWPLIHARMPQVKFHMIGSKAPDEIKALKGDGVVFHGFVEDLDSYLDGCRIAVAPLRYGAGVKGKVNMSMSCGQPVVATPIAVEGMYAEHGREVLVAETAQEFADEVVRLYEDETLWNRVSDGAIANVQAHFSLDAARQSLQELIRNLR